MNERDYKIAEAMIISTGAIMITTIIMLFYLYNIPFDMRIILTIIFIYFTTFFFGMAIHIKRRIMIKEFEEILKEIKN